MTSRISLGHTYSASAGPAQGQHMPMPPHPHVAMAAGPSWASPPPAASHTYGGTPPTSATYGGLVPISHGIIFSLGKIYW